MHVDTLFLLFLIGVFSVNSLDFVTYQLHFVLQLLHLTVHLVDKRITLLRRSIEETEVVLVGLHLARCREHSHHAQQPV